MIRFFLFRLFLGMVALLTADVAFSQLPGKVFPQGKAGVDYNVLNAKKKKEGPWIRIYQTTPTSLYYRGQFANGVPTGKFEFYYETGHLKSMVNHVQDTTINDVVNYYSDGVTKMSEGRYVGKMIDKKWTRQKQGIWKMYNEKGAQVSEESYVDDQLDGACKYFYDTGGLVGIVQFKAGKENGPFVYYHPNGKKDKEGSHFEGEYDGKFQMWYDNGSIQAEGAYIRGSQEGTWYYSKANGLLEVSILYKKGIEVKRKYENGTFTEYYDSGIPKSKYSFEEGLKQGPFVEWYDQGKFVQVPPTKEDLVNGIPGREKLEGQQIKVEGDYLDDHLEGEVKYYTAEGRLEKVEKWADGKLVETIRPSDH